MESPKESHSNQELGHSLKALTLSPEKVKPTLNMLATASSWSIGDYIGMESCLDINEEVQYSSKDKNSGGESDSEVYIKKCRVKREQRRAMRQREFPPPIPLLARTENLPCHMPWVLKRHYTSDGRLILTEERVKHHEYFRAHRADGRLTLQLVPLDDEVWLPDDQCDHCGTNDEEEADIDDTEEKETEKENEEANEVDVRYKTAYQSPLSEPSKVEDLSTSSEFCGSDVDTEEKDTEKENEEANNVDDCKIVYQPPPSEPAKMEDLCTKYEFYNGDVDVNEVEVEKEMIHKDRSVVVEESTKIRGGGIGGTATNITAGKRLNLNYNNVASPGSCIFEVPVQQYGQFIANTNLHLCDAISLGRA
ncbi:hypothetical protein CMV_030374 [Castanea mollissima]|uniref:FAF domain-containing protein n=1 Tax=Castanea mollissima TaxID=60419 RepID=A0A8J4Q7Y9_9ROSI|nr:hypothetical protein CMV_030374 [Castanea mollissima]